jgi:hypothetical protein
LSVKITNKNSLLFCFKKKQLKDHRNKKSQEKALTRNIKHGEKLKKLLFFDKYSNKNFHRTLHEFTVNG